MYIALLVGFSLLLVLSLGAIALAYSHYIYSKNRIFSKTKYSLLWIIVCSVVIVFMVATGSCFIVDLNVWHESLEYDPAFIGLSFACLVLAIGYLVYFCVLPTLTNKNKIAYDQILKVDYESKIKDVLAKIGDVEKCKQDLLAHDKRYFQDMLSYYENILNRLKSEKISAVEKMADIVTFNDAYTHNWSGKKNNYQVLLTYQFCKLLKNFS